ncbi:unnamed protein product [Parnassius apollo]|uniref:(apollo) hypothetical protein n=1 Tax=Parnassius apollo TaxID=110799 RepID=A0A8S3XKU2_PARAO|nr:unnamed protein product [Parnassius apollo]
MSSDHTPVILNIYKQAMFPKPLPNIYNKHTNWDQYREFIRSNIDLNISLKTNNEIEAGVEKFNSIVHMAATVSTPKNRKSKTKQKEYSRNIIAKDIERRKLRGEWHKTRYPSDKSQLNRATKELKDMIKEHENRCVQSHLCQLTSQKDTNHSLWRATKNLKQPKDHIPPLRKLDRSWARTDVEKTTAFAVHLEKVCTPLPCSDPDNDDDIANYLQSPNQVCPPLKAVSPKEISREVKCLSPNKVPGYDLLDSVLLSNLPRSGIIYLVTLFNSSIRLSHYPGQWKIAQVVMILKPGKQLEEVSSYRPISLPPLVGKFFEKVILNRMQSHLNAILPGHQFGFRQRHGTIEQVHRLTDTIGYTLENKKYCSAVFLDISQAFDRVWHDGLLFKIKKQLPHSFYFLLKSYLNKRCYEVKLNNTTSDLFEIRSGVPQGSILGPILYLIFTADISVDDKTFIATYADDTAIMSVNANPTIASAHLQKHIDEI